MRVKPNRYSTVRGLIRMSWSKYNFFNLAERRVYPDMSRKTLFQQMWQAKKEARAYHGGSMTERQFKTTWAREPLPVYGSVTSATSSDTTATRSDERKLPPMQTLTFAEIERRLDVVVFRSCFAPSVYAARQMVSHGKVILNGQKCKQPSFLMRDGDLLTVQPTAIAMLYAPESETEEKKPSEISKPTEGEKVKKRKEKTGMETRHAADSVADKRGNKTLVFKPRAFQHPWMFIPEYLEVNFKTCSTVFVRAPQLRPGRCEIPSPFPPEVHGLAHEWYSTRTKMQAVRRG